jgi:hypothetical protein
MDKMREEFEKHCIEKEGCPSNEVTNDLRVGFYAGYQAATAEAEKYKEALQKIASTTDWLEDTYFINIAKQALQK